jgi:hypothetical protein
MIQPHVGKIFEERISASSLEVLRNLVGCRYLHMHTQSIEVVESCCFAGDLSLQVVRDERFSPKFVVINVERFDTPKLDLDYYRYSITEEDAPKGIGYKSTSGGGGQFLDVHSRWTYDVQSRIEEIDIYERHSIPEQTKLWPDLTALDEATIYDAIIALKMSDGGAVTLQEAFGGTSMRIARFNFRTSFGLGPNYQLRLSIDKSTAKRSIRCH